MLTELTFGTWLKERRTELGITQDGLSERLGFSPAMLRKLEAGERKPSGQIASLLAEYFSVPVDEREAFVAYARIGRAASIPMDPASGSSIQIAPWRNTYSSQTNLPAVLTPLIGRQQEEGEVRTHLMNPKTRLLTLTGTPGIGKTRLALQVASDLIEHFADGVFFVDLAPVADPGLVLPAIARTLDLNAGDQPVEKILIVYLRERRMLLLLDNFEQVLDAGPAVVKLMEASPWLKVLVTSREALHLRGERQYPVPALRLPVLADRPSLEELADNPAVQLFVELAHEVAADFALTRENAYDVADVCINLDGLPLAIELAAVRVALFPPRNILSRLGHQLKVLTGGSRDLPPRHRTMRGAIAWSYDLLGKGEQELLSRMSVFEGGSTQKAIQAVCTYKEKDLDVADGLESLLSKNLLKQRRGAGGDIRFWMLKTIHEYAREKLEECGEGEVPQKEHALYFMRLAEEAEPHLKGEHQQEWLDRLEDEYDNLRAALAWAGDQANGGNQESSREAAEIGLRTAGAMGRFWAIRGLLTEGKEQMEGMLSVPEAVLKACPVASRAKVMNGAGSLAHSQGDYSSARSLLEGALVLGREAGDKQSISSSMSVLGFVTHDQGDDEGACALYKESLALRRELGDKWGIAACLNNLGVAAQDQGDYTRARALYEESLAVAREIGDKKGIAITVSNVGVVAHREGDHVGARALLEEGLALLRKIGDKKGISNCLNSLGIVVYEQGDHEGACALYKESLALRRELGDRYGIASSLARLGRVAVGMGQVERGTKLLGAVEGLLQSLDAVLTSVDRPPYESAVASARAVLGEDAFRRAWAQGSVLTIEQAVALALDGEVGKAPATKAIITCR